MICIGTFDVLEDTETFVDGNGDDNWALGEFFFMFFMFFFGYLTIYIGTTDILKVWCGSTRTRATTTTTGPNDARHVIWALGEFFFLFPSFIGT